MTLWLGSQSGGSLYPTCTTSASAKEASCCLRLQDPSSKSPTSVRIRIHRSLVRSLVRSLAHHRAPSRGGASPAVHPLCSSRMAVHHSPSSACTTKCTNSGIHHTSAPPPSQIVVICVHAGEHGSSSSSSGSKVTAWPGGVLCSR